MAKLYTQEKVLYFADREEGLHVDAAEPLGTDLSEHVANALKRKLIDRVASDDSGAYYRTTKAGRIRLLELQIDWRTRSGKCTDKHKKELAELKSGAAA
ncbi:MAG: hypothetical protein GY862_27130 [Gammaproteobacteria bacterium]|nr:hypothetical protein [Gammaproteobacteria bacterium]MCP5013871.1 hypothetical protein [Ketobacter sp.]